MIAIDNALSLLDLSTIFNAKSPPFANCTPDTDSSVVIDSILFSPESFWISESAADCENQKKDRNLF